MLNLSLSDVKKVWGKNADLGMTAEERKSPLDEEEREVCLARGPGWDARPHLHAGVHLKVVDLRCGHYPLPHSVGPRP